MNKVRLSFKDSEVEKNYQQKQYNDVRRLFFTVISIGLFVNYLVNVLNSIAMNRNDFLFWKITMMGYLIVQYYLIRRFPKFIRLAFIVTNHLNSGLYLFASDDSFTHEFDIIKGANQMALEIIIFLSGEFVDAALSIVTLNTLRMVYGIIFSPIQFYVPHITTVLLVGYFIYYFYQFHHAKRSQFLLALVDIEWDQILANLIQKTPYVIFTFDEEQLKFSIKQINNCNQIFSSKSDIFLFLRNSICHGKSVEQIIYEDIRAYSMNHKKRINIQLHAQYNKEIYRLKYSLYQAQFPTLLLMFKGQSQRKNKLAKFDRKYSQFVALFIKVLNNFNPNQEQFLECLQLKRQLYFFKLLGNIVDSQFHEKIVNLSQNLASISSLFPDKKIFFGHVECDIQIKTIGVILYFFEMIVLENSIGRGVKINFVQQEQFITLTFQGTFNLQKIRYIIQQLQFPLKMIILNFKVTIYSISIQLHQEPLIPFTRLQTSKYHAI